MRVPGIAGEIPNQADIIGKNSDERQKVNEIEGQEQHRTDNHLAQEIGSAVIGRNPAADEREHGGIDRVEAGDREKCDEDRRRREEREYMEPVPREVSFYRRYEGMSDWDNPLVDDHCQPANPEGEKEAFQIEARPLREIEQGRRAPIRRDEERFRESQERCPETHEQHFSVALTASQ